MFFSSSEAAYGLGEGIFCHELKPLAIHILEICNHDVPRSAWGGRWPLIDVGRRGSQYVL